MSPAGRARGRALPPRDFSRMTSPSESDGAKAKSLSFAEFREAAKQALNEEAREKAEAEAAKQSERISNLGDRAETATKTSASVSNPRRSFWETWAPTKTERYEGFWDPETRKAVGVP